MTPAGRESPVSPGPSPLATRPSPVTAGPPSRTGGPPFAAASADAASSGAAGHWTTPRSGSVKATGATSMPRRAVRQANRRSFSDRFIDTTPVMNHILIDTHREQWYTCDYRALFQDG